MREVPRSIPELSTTIPSPLPPPPSLPWCSALVVKDKCMCPSFSLHSLLTSTYTTFAGLIPGFGCGVVLHLNKACREHALGAGESTQWTIQSPTPQDQPFSLAHSTGTLGTNLRGNNRVTHTQTVAIYMYQCCTVKLPGASSRRYSRSPTCRESCCSF